MASKEKHIQNMNCSQQTRIGTCRAQMSAPEEFQHVDSQHEAQLSSCNCVIHGITFKRGSGQVLRRSSASCHSSVCSASKAAVNDALYA